MVYKNGRKKIDCGDDTSELCIDKRRIERKVSENESNRSTLSSPSPISGWTLVVLWTKDGYFILIVLLFRGKYIFKRFVEHKIQLQLRFDIRHSFKVPVSCFLVIESGNHRVCQVDRSDRTAPSKNLRRMAYDSRLHLAFYKINLLRLVYYEKNFLKFGNRRTTSAYCGEQILTLTSKWTLCQPLQANLQSETICQIW